MHKTHVTELGSVGFLPTKTSTVAASCTDSRLRGRNSPLPLSICLVASVLFFFPFLWFIYAVSAATAAPRILVFLALIFLFPFFATCLIVLRDHCNSRGFQVLRDRWALLYSGTVEFLSRRLTLGRLRRLSCLAGYCFSRLLCFASLTVIISSQNCVTAIFSLFLLIKARIIALCLYLTTTTVIKMTNS